MPGWFLFDYLKFLVILVWRMFSERGSTTWPIVCGKVAGIKVHPDVCTEVQVVYTYYFAGECFPGIYEEPFLSGTSANEFAQLFIQGSDLTVRVQPGKPERSVVRERDQSKAQSQAVPRSSNSAMSLINAVTVEVVP